MSNLYIIAEDGRAVEELCKGLTRTGYVCSIVSDTGQVTELAEAEADAVLMESSRYSRIGELSRRIKRERNLPIIALIHDMLDSVEGHLDSVDDFVVMPWDLKEVELRLRRLLRRATNADGGEVIRCGDLVIDLAAYEVFVSSRPVVLTFKEYELLKFLVSNRDRVFTREALLNKVWGYDYYGGDRTVDVHIQRLRSKIEGSQHVLIETVRNIGYRLRTDGAKSLTAG